jgi:hypothetical protein
VALSKVGLKDERGNLGQSPNLRFVIVPCRTIEIADGIRTCIAVLVVAVYLYSQGYAITRVDVGGPLQALQQSFRDEGRFYKYDDIPLQS